MNDYNHIGLGSLISMQEPSPQSKDYINEIAELIKNICLAVLNWELKQSDEYMYGIKKHQEEFILIKSQEVSLVID